MTCISAMLEGMGGRVGWTADMTNASGKIVDEVCYNFKASKVARISVRIEWKRVVGRATD